MDLRSTPQDGPAAAIDPASPKPGGGKVRVGVLIAGALGAMLAVGLIGWFGFGAVLSALARIGWGGFAVFITASLLVFPFTGGAWGVLAREVNPRTLAIFIWGRFLREGAGDLLPFSSLGGVLIGARGVTLLGVSNASAYGSLAVDLMTEIVAQIIYMILGLVLLSAHLSHTNLGGVFLACFGGAIVLALGMIGGLVFAQMRGLDLFGKVLERIAPDAVQHMQGVKDWIAELNRKPDRLAWSVLLHLGGWVGSAALSWMALNFMGVKLSFAAMIAIESLLSAVKSAAFMAPSGLGVQEAAYALLGQVFGLTPEISIALSLLKRARDVVLGVPPLLAWQALEGKRILRPAGA
ncbi:lysylphosphatidylglycerol synthase domain-containing protein [Caulobacter sp. S45]|uniref:lysylphosphatidylglycerol synthase domain-containing protein n=1 Tax=Caulobacter sp. S45 TaxID=1641861 RepID=UPI00131BD5D6|nr:lysylphosphatidylglycerol synthase domain-containing protein [Caulobacter sp. S45]